MLSFKKIIVLVFSIIFFISCNKNVDNLEKSKNLLKNKLTFNFVNPYSDLGEFHNNGLDSVYIYIQNHINSINTYDDLAQITLDGIKNYIQNAGYNYCEDAVNKGITVAKQYYNFFNSVNNNSPYDSLLNSGCFDSIQVSYINHMYNLYKKSLSTSDFYDSLNVLDFKIYSSLDSTEYKPLLMLSTILGKSYDYWNNQNNCDKWESLLNNIKNGLNKVSSTESTLGDIGEVDFVSAGAAVIPCIASTFGYINCVGGAALGGSVAEGVVKIVEWIF